MASSLRSVSAAPLRGRDPVGLDERPAHLGPDLPDVPAAGRHRGARPLGAPAPSADHVRVLPRDGQLERDPRRPLGRHRVDAGAPGRVHLGVVGPRAHPATRGRDDSLGVRRRLRRSAQRRELLRGWAGLARPDAEARALGAPSARRPGGDRIRASRRPADDHEQAALHGPVVAARDVGGHRRRRSRREWRSRDPGRRPGRAGVGRDRGDARRPPRVRGCHGSRRDG